MKKNVLIIAILMLSFVVQLSAQESDTIKEKVEWFHAGSKPTSYEMGSVANATSTVSNVLQIKSIDNKIEGFGTMMKTVKANTYLGKMVKMSAYVKSTNVKSWAGLWMRVDYYKEAVLAFDNMRDRPIRKTTDWTKYEVILFVPNEATSISYGLLLDSTGQIMFKDVTLEIIAETAVETGSIKGKVIKKISFEKRARAIGSEIKKITDKEKLALKTAVDSLDKEVENGHMTAAVAKEVKLTKATEHANTIDKKVAIEEAKLNQLVKDQVEGKVEKEKKSSGIILTTGDSNLSIDEDRTEINLTSFKVYNNQEDKLDRRYKRTTSQMVLAMGLNNLVTDQRVQNADFKYLGSHFYEWGLTFNSRIFKEANVLHAKYGLSLMYNNLRATDNRAFAVDGNQTKLEVNPVSYEDSRFRTVSLVVPLHLEFDFSKAKEIDGKQYFKTHDSFRLGIGGYFGANVKSKQITTYDDDGYKARERVKGDFNVNNFVYGLSTYIGYKATSLYLKYDLNPLFKDNIVKQNNLSLGVRFDFN